MSACMCVLITTLESEVSGQDNDIFNSLAT